MQIFLSWSGDKSKNVASAFYEWFPKVAPNFKLWMSSKDIEHGSLWMQKTSQSLDQSACGIVFLTKENMDKPWILLEVGALSMKGKGYPNVYFVDMDEDDLHRSSPFREIQGTRHKKEDVLALIQGLQVKNGQQADKEIDERLDFCWQEFDKMYQQAISYSSTILDPVLAKNKIMLLKNKGLSDQDIKEVMNGLTYDNWTNKWLRKP